MKIIHTSDWHLGARFCEEDRADEHEKFLEWLQKQIAEQKPDVLIISGDVFDIKAPSPAVQTMYYKFLADVAKGGFCRRVVVTAGNHDNAHLLAAPAEVLDSIGVSVVAEAGEDAVGEVVVVKDAEGKPGLVVGAVPFMYPAELSNFGADPQDADAERGVKIARGWERHYAAVIAKARELAPEAPLVLTGHCMMAAAAFSDYELERGSCVVGGLDAYAPAPLAAADYVALGHLHRPQSVVGYEQKMFYSGSPLAMSFGEGPEKKYINVVTFRAKDEAPAVEQIEVPRTVPILTVEGEPETVKRQLAELVTQDAQCRRFVRVRLNGFEGSAVQHWADIKEIVRNSATLVLEEEDMRPQQKPVAGLKVFGEKTIAQIRPREVAEQKLKTSNEHYSKEEIEEYMKMFDEVAKEIEQ